MRVTIRFRQSTMVFNKPELVQKDLVRISQSIWQVSVIVLSKLWNIGMGLLSQQWLIGNFTFFATLLVHSSSFAYLFVLSTKVPSTFSQFWVIFFRNLSGRSCRMVKKTGNAPALDAQAISGSWNWVSSCFLWLLASRILFNGWRFSSSSSKMDSVADFLRCLVCLVVPRSGPVYACANGHSVCGPCHTELIVCPTCGYSFLS